MEKGGLYNAPVTPVITVTDDNLDTVVITLNGDPFVSGTQVSDEGLYTLTITANDVVANSNTDTVQFELDLTAPLVEILFPAEGDIISAASTEVIAQTEANAVVTLTAGAYTRSEPADGSGGVVFPVVPLAPGDNLIVLSAVDRAGNQGPDASLTVTSLQALHCAFGGEIDEIDRDLDSEFKKRDLLSATLSINFGDGTVSELVGVVDDYAFSAVPGGPVVTFENNVDGVDRVHISGEGQYVGSNVLRRSLVNFQIELEDDAGWIESLDELEGQAWEQRTRATWQLNFSPRDMNSDPSGDGEGLGPARVIGTLTTGFCTSDAQIVAELTPLTLRAAPRQVTSESTDVEGVTAPGATVTLTLAGYSDTVTADAQGRFVFTGVPLGPGVNTIEVIAVTAGRTSNPVTLGVAGPAAAIPALGGPGLLLLILLAALTGGWLAGARPNHRGGKP